MVRMLSACCYSHCPNRIARFACARCTSQAFERRVCAKRVQEGMASPSPYGERGDRLTGFRSSNEKTRRGSIADSRTAVNAGGKERKKPRRLCKSRAPR